MKIPFMSKHFLTHNYLQHSKEYGGRKWIIHESKKAVKQAGMISEVFISEHNGFVAEALYDKNIISES